MNSLGCTTYVTGVVCDLSTAHRFPHFSISLINTKIKMLDA